MTNKKNPFAGNAASRPAPDMKAPTLAVNTITQSIDQEGVLITLSNMSKLSANGEIEAGNWVMLFLTGTTDPSKVPSAQYVELSIDKWGESSYQVTADDIANGQITLYTNKNAFNDAATNPNAHAATGLSPVGDAFLFYTIDDTKGSIYAPNDPSQFTPLALVLPQNQE
jgi:hypothetical protein